MQKKRELTMSVKILAKKPGAKETGTKPIQNSNGFLYCFVRTHFVPYCTKRHLLLLRSGGTAQYFDTPLQVTAHVLSCLFFPLALFLSGGRNVRGCLSLKSLLRSDPGRLSLTIARKSRVRKKTKQGTEAKILFPVRRAFPFRFRLGTSQGARMYYMLYVVHRRPLCFLCHHVGGYGNAEGESTADMSRLCLALFEGGKGGATLSSMHAVSGGQGHLGRDEREEGGQ